MFGLGMWEILVILILALVVIGPKKLPEIARTLGKGLREFRNATSEFKSGMDFDDDLGRPRAPRDHDGFDPEKKESSSRPPVIDAETDPDRPPAPLAPPSGDAKQAEEAFVYPPPPKATAAADPEQEADTKPQAAPESPESNDTDPKPEQ